MQTRRATPDDIPAITHLWHERMVILSQADARFEAHLQQQATWQVRLFDGSYALLTVAEKDAAIVGYIGVQIREAYAVICEIALDAHTYHGGLGAALLDAVQTWYATQSLDGLLVRVPRYHPVEQAFWRSKQAQEWTDILWQTPPEIMWMIL